jgi:hypothetical protein
MCSVLHEVPLQERDAGKALGFLRALNACGVRLKEVDLHPKASKAGEFRTRYPQWTMALEVFGRETEMADVLGAAEREAAASATPVGRRRASL